MLSSDTARLHKECDYSSRQTEISLQARISELEKLVISLTAVPSPDSSTSSRDNAVASPPTQDYYTDALRFQILFLDPEITTRHDAAAPPPGTVIPAAALGYLGDHPHRIAILEAYFRTVHQWMPVVGKIRLDALASTETQVRPRADYALLVLAMKLVQRVPSSSKDAAQDALYIATKEFSAKLDIACVHTLLKLHASILIAIYEAGHGIFPSGYISMGNCVTQAVAMGIQHTEAPQILATPRTWMDWEERQRVWWLLVILDRCDTKCRYLQFCRRLTL